MNRTNPTELTWHDKMVAAKSISKSDRATIQTMDQMKKTADAMAALTPIKDQPNPKKFRAAEHDKIQMFIGLIHAGLESWTEAGMMLVELQKEDANIKIKIRREDPRIGLVFLDKLESIGLGKLRAECLMLPFWEQRTMGMLPPAMQSDMVKGVVPVVNQRNGNLVQEGKRLDEMTQKEFRRSVGPSGPVPVREQIESIKLEEVRVKAHEARWFFEGHSVVFLRKCRVDAEALRKMLSTLESIKADASVIETEIKRRQITKK